MMIIERLDVVFSVVLIGSCVVVCAGFGMLTVCGGIWFLCPWCLCGTGDRDNGYMTVAVLAVRI